ncbi:MAG: hypothetical protein GF332_01570 [Candidatus Moranbacteria bacterium]|nr:hypothetical protein [Candidatus Moranbacteria bacterium]
MNKQDFNQLKLKLYRAWSGQNLDEAQELEEFFSNPENLKDLDPDWIEEAKLKIRWVLLPTLTQNEQLEMLRDHFLLPLVDKSSDLEKLLERLRMSIPSAPWLNYLQLILRALLENEQKLADNQLIFKNGAQKNATIGNWLRHYTEAYGMEKQDDEMAIVRFLANSPNAQGISDDYKQALKKLFLAFEYLKLPSLKEALQLAKNLSRIAQEIDSEEQEEERAEIQPQDIKPAWQPKPVPQPQPPAKPKFKMPVQQEVQGIIQDQAPTPAQTQTPAAQPRYSKNQSVQTQQQQPGPESAVAQSKPVVKKSPTLEQAKKDLNQPAVAQAPPANEKDLVKMPIKDALKTIPKVADQLITKKPLYRLGQPGTVPPTIQNWILDYRNRYGVSHHTEEDQRDFLHKSSNVQTIDQEDLNKLAQIVLSYDENAPLTISQSRGEVIFEKDIRE